MLKMVLNVRGFYHVVVSWIMVFQDWSML